MVKTIQNIIHFYVFEAFLAEYVKRGNTKITHDRKLHLAFFKAERKFPEIKDAFDFLLRSEPYSSRLHNLIKIYHKSGFLRYDDFPKTIYRIEQQEKIKSHSKLEHIANFICDQLEN